MPKLTLQDTLLTSMTKMADGNPGAARVLGEMMLIHKSIDPQCADIVLTLLTLDDWGIYGTDIYVLYSDKCNKDMRKLLMLLRAVQLGFFPQSKLIEMAKDQMYKVNLTEDEFNDLDEKVCAKLENFMKKE